VLPLVRPPLGVFSLTILSNTVLVGLAYPLVLAVRNHLRGHRSLVMFVGKSIPVEALATAYGSLLETPEGFTRTGLDVDALRMYLRWRGLTLTELRADPERYRDPASIPPAGERGDPGDGAVADGPPIADGGTVADDATDASTATPADPWGAAAFLADIEGDAYGTTPEKLRDGLEVVAHEETVWLTPGMPFIVPMFVGLVVALVYGDLLYALLGGLGLVP
jgi:preflagellin peptidase FlaK